MWLNKFTLFISYFLVTASFSVGAYAGETPQSVADTVASPPVSRDELNLKKIMAHPDWMGNSPTSPSWSVDEGKVFYRQKVTGHSHYDAYEVALGDQQVNQLNDKDLLFLASQQASKSKDATQGTFIFQDDLYWTEFSSGTIKALTSDEEKQSEAQFISPTKLSYLQGRKIFIYDLEQGLAHQIADFKTESDPDSKNDSNKSYLQQSQPRLLAFVKNKIEEKAFQKKRKERNRISKNKTWYLGEKTSIKTFRLSPDANWLILGTVDKDLSGQADHMPEFVTENGYVNDRKVRPLVGTSKPTNEKFYLVDLIKQEKYPLDTSNLPGINDDPLEKLKKKAAKKIGYKFKELQEPRAIYAYNWRHDQGVDWSLDGKKAAIMLFSYDNKDRWIIGVDVEQRKLKTLHWLSDEAWVNDWTFNEFGWLPDSQTLYYLSEEDGYSHLYIKKGKRRARQLTKGKYEVSNLTATKDGQKFLFKANKSHPGVYEVYQVDVKGGVVEALTELGGVNDYVLSPTETKLLVRHSSSTQMPELLIKNLTDKQAPVQITNTSSDEFKSISWQRPKFIQIPSSKIKRDIHARYYPAQSTQKQGQNNKKPAVLFVHGAGYLQNSHQGWSGYFREYMFHNMLTRQGYAVLDIDFRASKGYGRDWRTAIYRNMGTPELEDLIDGVDWLVANADVDPDRVGIYGGSYGGFMAFMALFKEPERFAAGAALRPVTDWAHYNHGYTSNILNTPQVDPDAYERSSPIEFADGLNKPLLIAHGMVDDNVFFKDSVRLVQRLIELEKTPYFETAIYPVEPHGFKQPSSWLDEYTRIHQLFERHLN